MQYDIHNKLKEVYGYDTFRSGQEEVIKHVLSGNDGLVIMPTGGGKSICYQIPALVLPHLTIVVSPLIALMDDQVNALKQNGVHAAAFHSGINATQQGEIIQQCRDHKIKLLYVSPERLNSLDFQTTLQGLKVSLVAVDESHCVSVWGNDFRPDYIDIKHTRDRLNDVPFLALTATADPATQEDICVQLHLKSPKTFVSSFERTNIEVEALPGQQRTKIMTQFIRQHPGSGIVYCLSRKGTQLVAESLEKNGVDAIYYHAGMSSDERKTAQDRFMQGEVDVICATIAFGMGIDKPDIRWVIHYNMPKNIEGYYQEIGRAGRDGLPSAALLFYSYYDMEMLQSFIDDGDASDVFKEVQTSKLKRMWEYATTTSCRTNVVLNYFGEYKADPCGHCDNCLNPPQFYDGTVEAQKVLSVIVRCKEQANLDQVVGVLRGSYRADIKAAGFTTIKTFGAGRETSPLAWRAYISQLIDKGYVQIAFSDKSRLRLSQAGKEVLFAGRKVDLVRFEMDRIKQKDKQKATISESKLTASATNNNLLQQLKQYRLSEAVKQKMPAYVIFNNKALEGLASRMPSSRTELLMVPGIGSAKADRYGEELLKIIEPFVGSKGVSVGKSGSSTNHKSAKSSKNSRGASTKKTRGTTYTYEDTLALLEKGRQPEDIASSQRIKIDLVYNHISYLFNQGKINHVYDYIKESEVDRVRSVTTKTGELKKAQLIQEHLDSPMPVHLVRLALAIINK